MNTIILPALFGGHTLFRTGSRVFSLKENVSADILPQIVNDCHGNGQHVLGYFDILQWYRPGVFGGNDVFKQHPDFRELNQEGCVTGSQMPKFASLWHPQVREALTQLMAEFAATCPSVDGIVLDCRLSESELLGYSESARLGFIIAMQIDPMDLNLWSQDNESDDFQYTRAWALWREGEVSRFVGELAGVYRGNRPGGKIFAMGTAKYFRWPLSRRNFLLNNWLMWAKNGHIDGALLEEDWTAKDNARLYEAMAELCKKEGAPIPLYPIIPITAETTPGQVNAAIEAIGATPPPPMIVYRVDSEEALKRLEDLIGKSGH